MYNVFNIYTSAWFFFGCRVYLLLLSHFDKICMPLLCHKSVLRFTNVVKRDVDKTETIFYHQFNAKSIFNYIWYYALNFSI